MGGCGADHRHRAGDRRDTGLLEPLDRQRAEPAQPGSTLLSQLAVVSSFAKWLNPLRMLGMAFLFTAIALALTVIIGTLRLQAGMLVKFYQQVSSRS